MNRVIAFVILFGLSISFCLPKAQAFNIYRVGDEIAGQEYNDILKRWLDKKFSIWVGVSDNNTEYILFKGETGLGDATVMAQNGKPIRDKLKNAVKKAIEWSDVARKNKADTSKSLGCFGSNPYDSCAENGSAVEENQMGLLFFAANGGKQTNLIISLIDRDNQFIKTNIYIDVKNITKMLNVVDSIENGFKKARKTANDQKLFK